MASNPIIRSFPVYAGNQKVAEANTNDMEINSGATAVFGAEGFAGHSSGAMMTKITLKTFVPVAGVSVDWLEQIINEKRIEISIPISGKYYKGLATIMTAKVSSNTKEGTCEGDVSLEFGKPQRS
jgi:hypothetical protein